MRVELTAASDEHSDAVVNEVEASLRQLTGVFDVKNDRDTGKREVTFSLKPEARTYGLTLQSLAFQVGQLSLAMNLCVYNAAGKMSGCISASS